MIEQILKQFDLLQNQLDHFCAHLLQNKPKCWLPYQDQDPHVKTATILKDLWYQDGQDGRETRSYFGLMGLNKQGVEQLKNINLSKDELRAQIVAFKKQDPNAWLDMQPSFGQRNKTLNNELQDTGLARLHLKQTHRHIPLLDEQPEKIGFSWYTSGRSIKRLDKKQALKQLEQLNTGQAHIQQQIEKLSTLPDYESLAQVQNQAPIMRANILFADGKRKSMNLSLPIFYPIDPQAEFPIHNHPFETPPERRTRLVRSDNQIDDDVFLSSIRAFRYRNIEE